MIYVLCYDLTVYVFVNSSQSYL